MFPLVNMLVSSKRLKNSDSRDCCSFPTGYYWLRKKKKGCCAGSDDCHDKNAVVSSLPSAYPWRELLPHIVSSPSPVLIGVLYPLSGSFTAGLGVADIRGVQDLGSRRGRRRRRRQASIAVHASLPVSRGSGRGRTRGEVGRLGGRLLADAG